MAAHPLRRPCLVAGLLKRHLDGAGAQVDFPQQASRCVASGWGVHLLRRPYLVARLLKRQLDGAGELVDFPQQASRCAASGWEVHVGRSQSVDSAGAYLARETTPCLALQRRRDTGEWRMSHRWQPRYSAPRGARVCLGLSGTGGARHVVSLREVSGSSSTSIPAAFKSGSVSSKIRPLDKAKVIMSVPVITSNVQFGRPLCAASFPCDRSHGQGGKCGQQWFRLPPPTQQ